MNRQASALELASARGDVSTLRLLVASSSTRNRALAVAARNGHLDAVNVLLEVGAKTDDPDHRGTTALMEAASGGHLSVVRRLLQAKANLEASSHRKSFAWYRFCTALHIGARKGLLAIVQTLVDAGGNTNAIATRNKETGDLDTEPKNSEGQSDDDFDDEQHYEDLNEDLNSEWTEEFGDEEFDKESAKILWKKNDDERLNALDYGSAVTPCCSQLARAIHRQCTF